MQWQNVRQVKYLQSETRAAQIYYAALDGLISFLTLPLLATSDPHGFAPGH